MSKATEFNYKFIKEQAGAGNWRRGYEYYLKDMVFDNYPEKNFYMGKVKVRKKKSLHFTFLIFSCIILV